MESFQIQWKQHHSQPIQIHNGYLSKAYSSYIQGFLLLAFDGFQILLTTCFPQIAKELMKITCIVYILFCFECQIFLDFRIKEWQSKEISAI